MSDGYCICMGMTYKPHISVQESFMLERMFSISDISIQISITTGLIIINMYIHCSMKMPSSLHRYVHVHVAGWVGNVLYACN